MKRLLKTSVLSILILLAIASAIVFWGYKQLIKPNNHSQVIITIEVGMSRRAIVDLLVKQGIVSSSWPLLVYLRLNPEKSKLQAGDYLFESPITPLEVIAKLNQGLVVTQQITIPEGYDKFDIIQALTDAQIDSQKEIEKAIANIDLIKDLDPEAKDLEGYLFPDTYTYTRQQKAPQIIAAMVKRFRQTLTPERQERIK
ncbi:MAG: endolytic transglycosylase MltG, partial [Blastocatellia bacterium]|nr:endolytic transglycosylase MltG [Blastocatellia bacterium]